MKKHLNSGTFHGITLNNDILMQLVITTTSTTKKLIYPKPFVKWVGGKRGIMSVLLARVPKQINYYYEPFVGGGALFFNIYNKVNHSYLSDLNIDLIVAYNTIKYNLSQVIKTLKIHHENHNEEYYYFLRSQNSSCPIENTARFIYLMKTCYNGLYRVNNKNEFNTPMGRYINPIICDEANLLSVSRTLIHATIQYNDFSKIEPKSGDFVYFDPPYHQTTGDSFIKYVSNGFSEKDQERLRDFAIKLSKNGVNVMISNSDTNYIIDLYKKHFKIEKILAPRAVNCKVDKRQSVTEVLITNY